MTVSRCTLSFGPYADASGAVAFAGLTGRVVPTDQVVELATGAVIADLPITITLDDTGTASLSLPHTDQGGISPRSFGYQMEWDVRLGGSSPGAHVIALPVAAGATADYDLLRPSVVEGVVVPIGVGPQGEQGPQGIQGIQGIQGVKGDKGDKGDTGTQGIQGIQGLKGDQGDRGIQGVAGDTGIQGIQGIQGPKGDKGDVGPVGPQGDQGIQGSQGIQGVQGIQGSQGDKTPASVGTWSGSLLIGASATDANTLSRTLTANTTITSISSGSGGVSYTLTLIVKQAATGAGPFTVTWPASIVWAGGAAAPTMPTAANAELIVHMLWTGTTWRAMVGGVFFP